MERLNRVRRVDGFVLAAAAAGVAGAPRAL